LLSDNPAARLLSILQEGQKHGPNIPCRNVWSEILNVDLSQPALLMSRLGKAMELPSEIIELINNEFPNQKSTYAYWSERVNRAFSQQNINANWNSFNESIDGHTISYLGLSAELIQTKSPTKLIGDDAIAKFDDQLSELFNELMESDIEKEFKEYTGRAIQKIKIAIAEYRISGALPIIESIETTFGHAFFDENYRKNLSSNKLGQKLTSTLTVIASGVSIAIGLPQLPESFQTLIEMIDS